MTSKWIFFNVMTMELLLCCFLRTGYIGVCLYFSWWSLILGAKTVLGRFVSISVLNKYLYVSDMYICNVYCQWCFQVSIVFKCIIQTFFS